MGAANDDIRVFSTSQETDFTKGQRLTKYPGHSEVARIALALLGRIAAVIAVSLPISVVL
jgi:hypothetical protein